MPASEFAQFGCIVSSVDDSPSFVEVWKNVLSLGDGLDDARLIAEFGSLSGLTSDRIPVDQSAIVEAFADVRVQGGGDAVKLRILEPTLEHIRSRFVEETEALSENVEIEIVILRVRRYRNS